MSYHIEEKSSNQQPLSYANGSSGGDQYQNQTVNINDVQFEPQNNLVWTPPNGDEYDTSIYFPPALSEDDKRKLFEEFMHWITVDSIKADADTVSDLKPHYIKCGLAIATFLAVLWVAPPLILATAPQFWAGVAGTSALISFASGYLGYKWIKQCYQAINLNRFLKEQKARELREKIERKDDGAKASDAGTTNKWGRVYNGPAPGGKVI